MRVEDFDDDQLAEYHLTRVARGVPHEGIAYFMQQYQPYMEFLYDLEDHELEELNQMLERGASKDEILLWLHERADAFLEESEKPAAVLAAEFLALDHDWERDSSGDAEAPTGWFCTLILDDRQSAANGWVTLEATGKWRIPDDTERRRLINAMVGYWLIKVTARGGSLGPSIHSTKFETLAELDQAFKDLNEQYSQWLEP